MPHFGSPVCKRGTVLGDSLGARRSCGRPIRARRESGRNDTALPGKDEMAESAIRVDLLNPGQVFACMGFMESVAVLLGDVSAAFEWRDARETTFRVSAAGSEPPAESVMRFLNEAKVVTRVHELSTNLHGWKPSWGNTPEVDDPGEPFPFPDPSSPATLPVVLRDDTGSEIVLDYWGDATRRDNVKFWAGLGGKPAAAIVRDALELVRGKLSQYTDDPFALSAVQTNSFRFDWRRDYIPAQDGFSPNKHANIRMIGYPVVEILAAVGVSYARPSRTTKLEYRYGVLGRDGRSLLDPIFHRAALGASNPIPGQPFRQFTMYLEYPGKEDQARCISHVTEEETNT